MIAGARLTAIYAAGVPTGEPAVAEAVLVRWVEVVRSAWPSVNVSDEDFVAHLARHAVGSSAEPAHLPDLFLACGCRAGDVVAVAELERRCIAGLRGAIWQVAPSDRDDVLQRVRELLLVGDGGEPVIARYAGQGSLRGWVRSVTMRTATRMARGSGRTVPIDEVEFLELAATVEDRSLDQTKQRYRVEFRAAFRAALDSLAVRQRNLLRQYFLDHMSIDELGTLYRVHRATAARWIHDVRDAVIAAIRAQLQAMLGRDGVSLASVLDAVASQLELSLGHLVDEPAVDPRG